MPQPHYIGSPEDSGEWPVLREPRESKAAALWKRGLWFAVIYAALAGAVLLVAMLAGCTHSGPWRASFEVRYANGKLITSGHAGEGDPQEHGSNPRADQSAQQAQGASQAPANGDYR